MTDAGNDDTIDSDAVLENTHYILIPDISLPEIEMCIRDSSYAALDKIMRATDNPDFFAGLPMQTAQQVLKDAVHDFKAWLDSLKEYKKNQMCIRDRIKNELMFTVTRRGRGF